jgi:NAD(P)-dependent dehydrogenase (short-subunit alcohol dehydrogenase family)
MRIAGSVALVTGANRGIGRAFVVALLERDAATVYATSRDGESAAPQDERVRPLTLDVIDAASVAAAATRCTDLQLLVNNAGINTEVPLLGGAGIDAVRADFETNVLGTLRMVGAFAPILATNGGGAVVNMLSLLSFQSVPEAGPYGASKAAAWSLTQGLRLELESQGTQIFGVHVGVVETEMTAEFPPPKVAAAAVAAAALDGVESGAYEVLVDERSRAAKAQLALDPRETYAEREPHFRRSPEPAGQPSTSSSRTWGAGAR